MLNVAFLIDMLGAFMLCVNMLSVIMLSDVVTSLVAP
jgi:hypothetical protein